MRGLAGGAVGRVFAASCVALLIAGCSSASGTLTTLASQTVATATATATAATTPAASDTATSALTATAMSTTSPNPAQKATSVPTALPPLAVGLCKASQLKLGITLWVTDMTNSYAHVTASNKSSSTCNMRGTSEARIADGHGNVIADAGASSAKVVSSDTIYPLKPGGSINTIVTWSNWCHAAPVQKVFVAMVLPFGLGGFVSKPLGDAPIPTCYASKMKTQVSSEGWTP